MRLGVLVLALLLVGGCNLFSPFYDEGKSDDLDDTIGDVEAALQRGEPGKAYEYAQRGIEKFPGSASLYYLGAVARVQSAEIGFADFASMISGDDVDDDGGGDLLASRPPLYARAAAETTWFLDLSPEDLERMADAFSIAYGYLDSAVALIARGEASEQEVEDFGSDSQLGLGMSGLLTVMLTVLDLDHNLANGFSLHPTVRAFSTPDGGWSFTVGVDPAVICDAMPDLLKAQEALYDHYRDVVGGDLPEDIPGDYIYRPTENWVNPWIDDGVLSGEFFANVHDGIVNFHDKYSCAGEVSRHE
jgi:hypothetical protein